jgi:hemolysin activation/secretion protein
MICGIAAVRRNSLRPFKTVAYRMCAVALAVVLSMALSSAARAQQATRPAPVDPFQTEKAIDAQQTERRRAEKPPPRLPKIARPEVQGDTRPLFVLKSVSIEGATAVPEAALAELYQPYLGAKISQADMLAIANAVSERYRSEGYQLTRAIVPKQDIKAGRLRIQVIEGSIADLDITGEGADAFGVRKTLAVLLQENPTRLATLERQLLIVNDTPGVRVADTALDEIGTATGRFRLSVTVATWRIYTSLGLDNSGTSAVGPLQAYSTTAFNSYLAPGDTFAVNLSTVPNTPKELRFGRLSYDVPIGVDGIKIGGSASHSEIWPGDSRRQIATQTVSESYELRGSITPLQTRKTSLTFTAAANLSDPYEKTLFGYNYQDHIRTVSLALDYKLQDPWDGWNYVTLAARHGLNVLGASPTNDLLASRYGASPDFSAFAYAYSRYQTFSDAWSLKTSVYGQFASKRLYTSQQFYLGGAAFGPGYYSGDNGVAGLAELRFDQTVENIALMKGYQLFGFVDGGHVWDIDAGKASLVSVGGGVRLHLMNDLHASLAGAVPVNYSSRADTLRDARFLFSLTNSFKWCPERTQMRCV